MSPRLTDYEYRNMKVDHNYPTTNAMLATPIIGTVRITIISNDVTIGETTTTKSGIWRRSFELSDGEYVVDFNGNFRTVGPTSLQSKGLVTSHQETIIVCSLLETWDSDEYQQWLYGDDAENVSDPMWVAELRQSCET